jgi:hypothetical protein
MLLMFGALIMNENEIMEVTREQIEELTNILIDSSLYLGMPQMDRQKLLNYLVSSYFSFLPNENNRALPKAIQIGPTM